MSDALLSQGAYLEASNRSTGTLTFAATPKTVTRAAGDWTADGLVVGQRVAFDTPLNSGVDFVIASLTATVLTLATAPVNEGPITAANAYSYVKVKEVTSIPLPSGSRPDIDVTSLDSTAREYRKGLRDEGSISGEMNFLPNDPGQTIMATNQNETLPRAFAITIPAQVGVAGYRWSFFALVSSVGGNLSVDEKAVRNFDLRITGRVAEVKLAAL